KPGAFGDVEFRVINPVRPLERFPVFRRGYDDSFLLLSQTLDFRYGLLFTLGSRDVAADDYLLPLHVPVQRIGDDRLLSVSIVPTDAPLAIQPRRADMQ